MSLTPYVHVDEPLAGAVAGASIQLGRADAHHLARVLRLADGASIEVADGAGAHAPATLVGDAVELAAAPDVQARAAPRIVVAQALNKGRKFDDVLRQVGELGADAVIPLRSERSVVKLDAAKASRVVERWQAVARATAEQSRQPFRLRVAPVTDIAQLARAIDAVHAEDVSAGEDAPGSAATDSAGGGGVDDARGRGAVDAEAVADLRVVAVPGAPALPTRLQAVVGRVRRVTVAVGPEGGFSGRDLAGFDAAGFVPAGMGPTVLRTEHAAPTAVAVIAAMLGRW